MKTNEEIGKEVWRDWNNFYYKTSKPDESNMGDVAEWARREYVRELLGIFSCTFCHEWFESPHELGEHLSEKHSTKIYYEPRYTGYGEYSNSYYIDSRVYDFSKQTVIKGVEK